MNRGDIYLAPFTYADLQGSKRRPVCVVSSASFNVGADVIVAMVTSSTRRLGSPGAGDAVVTEWRQAGLLRPSVIRTGRLLVLETRLLSGPIAVLTAADLEAVDKGLKGSLGLQ